MPTAKKSTGNFAPIDPDDIYRLIYRSWGPEKSGKNHFGFTGPAPIYGLYLDPGGVEGVAQKFVKGTVKGFGPKEINAVYYRFKKNETDRDAAIEMRDTFLEDYALALRNARTIQLDETELWELFRWAEFDGESDAPRNYGALNAKYRQLLQDAYDSGVNLQLVQKIKERWTQNAKGSPVPSGVFEPMGFKEANYIVQANLEHSYDAETGKFSVRVVNCRQNMGVVGTHESLTFPELGSMVFGEESEDSWR